MVAHEPQWFGSIEVFAQVPEQSASPGPHPDAQRCPPLASVAQSGVAPSQRIPQLPHVAPDESAASQPSLAMRLQSAHPRSQTSTHVPAAHELAAFGALTGHATPQLPQCIGSTSSAASQPSVAMPLQSPQPASHPMSAQVPLVQDVVAWGRPHTTPHAPQLVRVRSVDSHPSAGPLQS